MTNGLSCKGLFRLFFSRALDPLLISSFIRSIPLDWLKIADKKIRQGWTRGYNRKERLRDFNLVWDFYESPHPISSYFTMKTRVTCVSLDIIDFNFTLTSNYCKKLGFFAKTVMLSVSFWSHDQAILDYFWIDVWAYLYYFCIRLCLFWSF